LLIDDTDRRVPLPEFGMEGTTYLDGDDHVSLTIPDGWHVIEDPLPDVTPRFILAAGSWDFSLGNVCWAGPALRQIPADGTFLWLIEYEADPDRSSFPQRPDRFSLDKGSLEWNPECGTRRSYEILFGDSGRSFEVHVVVGDEVTPADRGVGLGILDSLRVQLLVDCGVTPLDEDYGAHLETAAGRPGDPLVVVGTTFRTEGGRWAPSVRIEVWWDYNWRWGPPGVFGSYRLLTIETGAKCEFRASAVVPDVEPGVYRVSILIVYEGGHGVFGEGRFTVEG
jgi:hypothetical protein